MQSRTCWPIVTQHALYKHRGSGPPRQVAYDVTERTGRAEYELDKPDETLLVSERRPSGLLVSYRNAVGAPKRALDGTRCQLGAP